MLSQKILLLDFLEKESDLSVSDVAHHFAKPDGSDSKVWYGYLRELKKAGAITYPDVGYPSCTVTITTPGKEILETELRQEKERNGTDERIKRIFRHEWYIAIFSAIAGALLSRPLWSGIEWIVALLSKP